MQETYYYDPAYILEMAALAKKFLLARDAYLKAWHDFYQTCLGCSFDPETEADVIANLLKAFDKNPRKRK